MTTFVVPVKPFGVAKERLSGVLDRTTRARLGKAVAAHTVAQARAITSRVMIVTPDDAVAAWAADQGCMVIAEPTGAGLNAAAALATGFIDDSWVVLHADLPLLQPADAAALADAASDGWVLAPAHDGGTSAVGGRGSFRFSYGPGSFRRHLAATDRMPMIISSVALAVDLDDAHDLEVIRRHAHGSWIERYLG